MTTTTVTVSTSPANRKELSEAFGGNQSAVRRIESITKDVTVNLPDAIDGSATVAQQALALAQALQQLAFVVAAQSSELPNADVLVAGTGLSMTISTGTITIALTVPVSVANGGTGASVADAALANLGGVPLSSVGQPDGVASLNASGEVPASELPPSVTSLTAGTGISVSAPTGGVTVALEVPVSVANGGTGATEASGAALDNIAGFGGTGLLERTGAGAYSFIAPSTYLAAANDLSDLASAPDARTNLGLGTLATQAANDVAITGGVVDGTNVGSATPAKGAFTQVTNGDTNLMRTSVALANGAGTAAGTITNAPVAGNPTKWVAINDNGTTRYVPAW